MRQWIRVAVAAVGLFLPSITAAQQAANGPERWTADIERFEAADRQAPFAQGGAVFVGSSSIRFWDTLAEDFPHLRTLNRGFGGSRLSDVRHYLDELVTKHRPRVVVLYAGENDIAYGGDAEGVFNEYIAIVSELRRELPETRLVFVSVKPGPTRWDDADEIRAVNAMVMEFAARDPLLDYVDVFTPMLGPDGLPIPELFVEDGIHMTPAGYDIWTGLIEPYLRPYTN